MLPVQKNSGTPLYAQIVGSIRQAVSSGELPPGAQLPTEDALCCHFGVSRYPLRQAMALLVEEGLLVRTRGKGTFVAERLEMHGAGTAAESRDLLAIILPGIRYGFHIDILKGFSNGAASAGYGVFVSFSDGAETEADCIESACRRGASGIAIIPADETGLSENFLEGFAERGVHVCVVDRNPGFDGVDYVGSDNNGGGYLAARHMHQQGYRSAVFVSDAYPVASVAERLAGFRRGLRECGMRLLNETAGDGPDGLGYGVDCFADNIAFFKGHLPFAVFAENDGTAGKVISILCRHGLAAGADLGVIGFDDSAVCKYLSPPLTTVAQNGVLLGETAAALAIRKITSGSKQSVRHILPTQLIARSSCGEGRAARGEGRNVIT